MIPQSNSWTGSVPCSSTESTEMKGMWFNQSWDTAISPSPRAIWQLPVEHALGFLPELVPPAVRLLSLSPAQMAPACHRDLLPSSSKARSLYGFKGQEKGVVSSWNQPLQAVALYPRKVHTVSSSYERGEAELQTTGVPWACVPFCCQEPLLCWDRQRPAYTPPLLRIFWHFEVSGHCIPLNPTRFRKKEKRGVVDDYYWMTVR